MFKSWCNGFDALWFMSPEGGAGSGGGGEGGQGGAEGGGTGGAGGATGGTDETQAKIDAAAAAARKSAEADAKKASDKAAQDLGYKDHADMLAQVKASKDAQLTEADKAKKAADEAKVATQAATDRANRIAVNADVKLLAQTMGCDPDVAVAMIDRTNIKVGDDDKVVGVKEALEALKVAKPGLFGQTGGAGAGGSVNPGGGTTNKTPTEIAAEMAKERKGGVDKDPWA